MSQYADIQTTGQDKKNPALVLFNLPFHVSLCYILGPSPFVLIIRINDAKFVTVLYSDLLK